ncbi:acyl carrier protein [Herbaspirillum lusitanum]|uniref:acyl carrier protein n=1 Tax=Herbaspirillum lusitanum TaxID=213312 RepID=UPI002238F087|nr:acyl carrier protein [Herbaspirillum lusitanum]
MNQRLAALLAEVFNLRREQIVPTLTKAEIPVWDSLKQMDLVVSLEREFGIALEIPDIVRMNSVSSIIETLTLKGVDLGA